MNIIKCFAIDEKYLIVLLIHQYYFGNYLSYDKNSKHGNTYRIRMLFFRKSNYLQQQYVLLSESTLYIANYIEIIYSRLYILYSFLYIHKMQGNPINKTTISNQVCYLKM